MNNIEQQYNNCVAALRFLKNNVKSDDFDGELFDKYDQNANGCLVHHMYHKALHLIPNVIIMEVVTRDICWVYDSFCKLLDEHYGDGAAVVLADDASDCGTDYDEFVEIFERHTNKIGATMRNKQESTFEQGSNRVDYEVRVVDSSRSIMYNILKDAESDFDALKKFGIAAELIECTSTVARRVMRS